MVSDEQTPPQAPDPGPLALLAEALVFLTRLPIRASGGVVLARAMPAFAVAGALIGAAGAVVYALASLVLPPLLAAILAQGGLCLLTGALHEDGLADMADGLGVRGDRARRLGAMRDSHIGVYGALALMLALAARIGALAVFGGRWPVAAALIAAHALSRAAIPCAMQLLAPARNDGLGAAAAQPTPAEAGIAATIAIVIAALFLHPGAALAAVIAVALGSAATAWLAERTFGGFTGDVLGAIEQVGESLALLAAAALLK